MFSPSAISIHLRGSREAHDLFLRNLDPLWSSILSRDELNKALSLVSSQEIASPPVEPHPSPRRDHQNVGPPNCALQSQVSKLQETVSTLIAALGSQQTVQTSSTQASAINSRSVNCCSPSPGLESGSVDCSDGTISSSEDEHDTVVEERHLNLHQAPADSWGLGSSLPQSCMSSDSFFAPLTSEKDPDILDPSPSLTSQAIQCQQLGSTG